MAQNLSYHPGMKTDRLVATALMAGFAERVVWSVLRPTSHVPGEAFNVASALASGRGFADAYRVGQGATAHLLPISPLIAGGVYRLFAGHAAIAEAVLALWSITLVLATYFMGFKLAEEMGCNTKTRLAALFFACIVPPYLAEEAADFRVWEGSLALFLAMATVLRVVQLHRLPNIAGRDVVVVGVLCALTLFVNPLLGASCLTVVALLFLFRGWTAANAKSALTFGLSFALPLTLLLGIWAHRNYVELGSPVLLRSNAGLELALANHQGALEGNDLRKTFLERLQAIHPFYEGAFNAMQAAGGEVRYSNILGRETEAWIADHPIGFTELLVRHLREQFAPEPWQFAVFGSGKLAGAKSAIASIVGLGGLASLLWLGWKRNKPALYCLAFVVPCALLTSPFQPVPRYTYLLYPVLLFSLASLWQRRRERGETVRTGFGMTADAASA